MKDDRGVLTGHMSYWDDTLDGCQKSSVMNAVWNLLLMCSKETMHSAGPSGRWNRISSSTDVSSLMMESTSAKGNSFSTMFR